MAQHAAANVVMGSLKGLMPDDGELRFLRKFRPAGLTLFRRNIPEAGRKLPDQLCHYLRHHFSDPGHPFLIAIDQEGGRVRRLRGEFPDPGPAIRVASGLSETDQEQQLFHWGLRVGQGLQQAGIHINFAPCLDVFLEPGHDSIGDRSYSSDPALVTLRAGAFMRGLQEAGILTCLKHFPGQGAALTDTHLGPCVTDSSARQLMDRDIRPFRDLADKAPMIMTSHCIYPALDTVEASLSEKIMKDLLRTTLGFKGVIVTDDMTMGAITRKGVCQQDLIAESIARGADMALVCEGLENWQLAIEALIREAEKSPVFRLRLQEASARVCAMRAGLTHLPPAPGFRTAAVQTAAER